MNRKNTEKEMLIRDIYITRFSKEILEFIVRLYCCYMYVNISILIFYINDGAVI